MPRADGVCSRSQSEKCSSGERVGFSCPDARFPSTIRAAEAAMVPARRRTVCFCIVPIKDGGFSFFVSSNQTKGDRTPASAGNRGILGLPGWIGDACQVLLRVLQNEAPHMKGPLLALGLLGVPLGPAWLHVSIWPNLRRRARVWSHSGVTST